MRFVENDILHFHRRKVPPHRVNVHLEQASFDVELQKNLYVDRYTRQTINSLLIHDLFVRADERYVPSITPEPLYEYPTPSTVQQNLDRAAIRIHASLAKVCTPAPTVSIKPCSLEPTNIQAPAAVRTVWGNMFVRTIRRCVVLFVFAIVPRSVKATEALSGCAIVSDKTIVNA